MESGVLEQRWCAEFTFEINLNRRKGKKKKIEGSAVKFCATILYVLKKPPGMCIPFDRVAVKWNFVGIKKQMPEIK